METAINNLRDKSMSRLTVYKHLNLVLESPQKDINKKEVKVLFNIFHGDLLQGTQNGINSLILNSIKLIVDEIKDDVAYSEPLKNITKTVFKHLIAIVRFPQVQANHKTCWEMISSLSDSILKSVIDSDAKQIATLISQSLNEANDKTVKILIAKVLLRWLKTSTKEELPRIVADLILSDENQKPNIETMELVLPHLRNLDYVNNPKWTAVMSDLQKKKYTPILLHENIPALYEDLSQSQDDYNMTGWKPAGYANDETSESSKEKSSSKDCMVRNDNHKSNPTESTDELDKDESVDPRNPNDTTVKKASSDIIWKLERSIKKLQEGSVNLRPICDTFNESVRPNGDISNDQARPNCNISDDHARPNCDISNDHARTKCNSSNDHAGPNCDISDDHDRLNCDISNDHAGPNCVIYSASVKPSCDISNESAMLNEGKQVEKNEVTTPSAKKVYNSKIYSTPTSNHENISLKLNITPTADTVQMLPESERPIRKRKRPNKFDPEVLRFIGKRRASSSIIDHLRGSFSSDVDDSSETSSVSSEVSSSQSKNEEDDTTSAKIKKRKLRLLKALAIDTVDGHPSKNMFDYDKPICRRSMTGGTNEPKIKKRRISISSEPKPKQKKTKIDKTKKRVQEVVDLEEKQNSACEIITITESQPTVIVDHVMKPVDESVVVIDHTQNTLVEDTVELSKSPIEIIDRTPKNIVQEKTDTLELFDESAVEVLGEEDPVCQSITDSSKSVEISNQAVIKVVGDEDTVCQENTALPESEDVIQISHESDSNISMTQKRISKMFIRIIRSPKVTDDKNESVANYYVVNPDTQIDSTADMVTLPVYDENLSEKEVADKSTEAVQLSASKTVETAEVDTEMLDVETQILEEKKDVALFKDSVTVGRTSEVLVKDNIEIGTYVSKDEADLNMKDEEFPAENVIDVFDCKNECTDDDDQTNRSTIISSPYRDDIDDRNADLLNRTLDISPIKSVEQEDRMEIENDDFESLGCKVLSDESCSDTDQANSPCDSKTSSPVRTAESPLKTVSPPASDKVVPSENQSPPRGIYSPTSSMNQKRNRPLASRVGGRAAQMLGMCKRGFDGSDNKFSNDTSLSPVRMIARKNLHSFYGQSSDCIENAAENTEMNTCSTDHIGDSDYVNDANRAINLMSDTDKILILKEILKHDAASNYLVENLFDFISVVRKT